MKNLYKCKENGIGKKVNVEGSPLAIALEKNFGLKAKYLIDCETCEDFHSLDFCERIG
tara:strand:+ start:1063 stop:1236 length:174 start_codon:yes stop_codon:yes gene_type:complete